MDDTKVQVHGMANLIRTLRAAEVDLDELKNATDAAGRIVLAAAMSTAPARSGALAGSGKKSQARRRARIQFGSGSVPYAPPIHWGWPKRNIGANPWASRAAQSTEPVWVAAYVVELAKIADKVHGA